MQIPTPNGLDLKDILNFLNIRDVKYVFCLQRKNKYETFSVDTYVAKFNIFISRIERFTETQSKRSFPTTQVSPVCLSFTRRYLSDSS